MMQLKTAKYGSDCKFNSLEDYAESKLDGDDYGRGAMEATTETARNNSKAIGRLLDLLAEVGFLSAEQVLTIIEGYSSGTASFIKGDQEND